MWTLQEERKGQCVILEKQNQSVPFSNCRLLKVVCLDNFSRFKNNYKDYKGFLSLVYLGKCSISLGYRLHAHKKTQIYLKKNSFLQRKIDNWKWARLVFRSRNKELVWTPSRAIKNWISKTPETAGGKRLAQSNCKKTKQSKTQLTKIGRHVLHFPSLPGPPWYDCQTQGEDITAISKDGLTIILWGLWILKISNLHLITTAAQSCRLS